MKTVFYFFYMFLCTTDSFGQFNNHGQKLINESLQVLEKYLTDPNSSKSSDRASIVHFFTELTGIASKSDGSYIGQISPTKEDVINWSRWFLMNQENISWDEKSGKIILTKCVAPPLTNGGSN
jgi:hypothetical protein